MSRWQIEFYETAGGACPVAEYLDSLSDHEAGRVTAIIDLLAEYGTSLSGPHVRRIQGSRLWELRVRGRNHHRVFYVAAQDRRFVLLHAFAKKSQRTPQREIRTAERRLADYEERFGQ